jgi:death-on-curing protein
MERVTYLTIDQVKELHDDLLAAFGGAPGVQSAQLLASAVFQPQQSAGAEDAYPTISEKAAALAFGLIMNHAFTDGNKRTAAAALDVFLDVNGYELLQTDEEIEEIIVDVAAGTIDQGEFFGWVCNHTKPKVAEVVPFQKAENE